MLTPEANVSYLRADFGKLQIVIRAGRVVVLVERNGNNSFSIPKESEILHTNWSYNDLFIHRHNRKTVIKIATKTSGSNISAHSHCAMIMRTKLSKE